ncbi:MAG: hypothetical protein R3A44_30780 [Caldilineaceae bacterium]
MTTTIHEEITIDLGDADEDIIHLWMVTYGTWPEDEISERRERLLNALQALCARQGWLLEYSHGNFEM